MAVELATAYISIVPDTSRIRPGVRQALGQAEGDAGRSGERQGSSLAKGIGKTLKLGGVTAAAGIGGLMATALGKGFTRLQAIDQAEAKLKGLGNSTADVAKIMQSANDAVKGTAFGMGEAADTAASAVAAGIKPGEDLTRTLKSIADAAAIAGVPMNEMGQIFNKVAASGKLQGDELNQLMERGIPILQLLGKATGKTSDEVREMASKGQIDFATFRTAMEGGMGGAAVKMGNTFKGALDNMMAALGRFGAKLLGPIFKKAPEILGSLTAGVDVATKNIEPMLDSLVETIGNAFNGLDLSSIGGVFMDVVSGIGSAFSSIWTTLGPILVDLGGRFKGLGENLISLAGGALPLLVDLFKFLAPIVATIAQVVGAILVVAFRTLVTVISTVVGALATAVRFFNEHRTVLAAVAGVIAAVLLPYMIVLAVGYATVATAAVISGIRQAGAWAMSSGGAVKAAAISVIQSYRIVGGWIAMGAAAIAQAARVVAGWVMTGAGATKSAATSVVAGGRVVVSWVAQGAAATAQGARVAAGWAVSAAGATKSAGTAVVAGGRVVASWIAQGATATAQGARVGAAWLASSIGAGAATARTLAFAAAAGAVKVATLAWTGVQWLLNVALNANPVGLIVMAIAALIAAVVLIATKTTWFQTIWGVVWAGIQAAISAVWNGFLSPIFTAIGAAFSAIGNAAMWLWNSAILPAFNGIQAVISLWWTGVQIYFNAVKAAIGLVGAAAMWLWNNAILPAFNGIGSVISFAWNNVVRPTFDAIKGGMGAVGDFFSNIWNNIIKPVWDALGNGIKWVWENLVRPAFDAMKTAITNVGNTFTNISNGIRDTWDKIKEFAAAPIRFVVNRVWNDGLRAAWDKIDDFLPIPKAPAPMQVAFAKGGGVGMTPGARKGKDSVNALLMPDEHVWDVKSVAKSGGQGAQYAMRDMVKSGKPFTWTPAGVADASEGGPLMRFADGGAVSAGDKLTPGGGEGGLQPIAIMMSRIIKKLWPKGVSSIGGYRAPDGYNEHSSGRALDVMINDSKTGTQIKDWSMANSPKFPVQHTIWEQKLWTPPNGSEPMEDRGDPTQNHMDHDHIWYKPQNADPNVVPEGLVGFDGMTDDDKRGWLRKKVEEIINNIGKGIKEVIGLNFDGKADGISQIPGAFFDKGFKAMTDKAFEVVKTLSDPGKWYEMGKNLVKDVLGSVPVVGGLFRDSGGFVPTGQSIVTNETGKPEAVLNWEQLQAVVALMESGKSMSDALAEIKPGKPESDVIPEGSVVLKQDSTVDDVKKAAAQIKAQSEAQKADADKAANGAVVPADPNAKAPEQPEAPTDPSAGSGEPQLSPKAEYDKGIADSISENFGNAAKSAVSGQVTDLLGVFSIGDSPPMLAAYNNYVEEKKKYDEMQKKQKDFESGTTSGTSGSAAGSYSPSTGSPTTPGSDYVPSGDAAPTDPSDQVGWETKPSGVPDVGPPGHDYNPGGGAEQWRGLAEWAIGYAKKTMSGPAQTQAMVEQIDDESSGNPRAVNNSDSNAAAGTPSGGLLQVIEPTFQTNRDPSLPNDKFDPAANLVAALRYYSGRYGQDLTTNWGHGKGGYKLGGYTGNFGVNTPAGIVHGKEFVINAEATARNYGVLSAINSGLNVSPANGGRTNAPQTVYNIQAGNTERAFNEAQRLEKKRMAIGLGSI